MKEKVKYLLPVLVILLIFAAVILVRMNMADKMQVLTYRDVLNAQDKTKELTHTGKREDKTAKQLGIPSGFYDVHILAGSIESFPTVQISAAHAGKSIFISGNDQIRFSAHSSLLLTPSRLDPLTNFKLDGPINLIVGKQIPAGKYEIEHHGEWKRLDSSGKPTQVTLIDVDWNGNLIKDGKERMRSLSIESFDEKEREGSRTIIDLKDKTLLKVSFFYQMTDSSVELKPVESSDNQSAEK
ncbi:MAG: hypothetical protein LBV19_10480 [Streptococcaceae bacterium]|jgi:hypothetical protein|nr:hypothetical protein [Streptococcaceae bacterium]